MTEKRTIRDCPVAVVGGAGFLGSHLVDHLVEDRGCKVLAIDNLVAGRLEFLNPKADFEHADITDSEEHLRKLFVKYQVEYVANYAAFPYVPTSFVRPLHVCNVNFFGALKVINAAQEAGCKAILQVSSAEIYGGEHYGSPLNDGFDVKIDEDFPVTPHSSYGASKAAVDAMVQVRWREAKTPCIALRQFNCVGERETHPYVVPEIISQLSKQKASHKGKFYFTEPEYVVKLGNDSFRDFLYAGCQARMATELLEKGNFGEVYNLGSEEGIQIYDLAKLIGEVMGIQNVEVVRDESRVRPWEIWSLLADCRKLYQVIQSRPTVPLREALAKTIDWYRANGCRWGFKEAS